MKTYKLDNMTKGWFVGNFEPSALNAQVEVAIKRYKKGDYESKHHHRIATEITVIVSGRAKMNGLPYTEGDIIVIEPFESADFEALEDTVTCVYKSGSFIGDKYLDD